jgi:hypothetical protein
MTRWRMPPGELVRIRIEALRGRRDANELHQRERALARLAPAHAAMLDQRLGDLEPDLEDRVQRRHRLLEDHADAVAAHRLGLRRARRRHVGAVDR